MAIRNSKVYYQSNAVTIYYHEESALGMTVWQSPISSYEVREATILLSHTIERFRITGWLSDVRLLRVFQEQDINWILENVLPALLTSSLTKFAILLPLVEGDPAHAAPHFMHKAIDLADHLQIQNFFSKEQAIAWLLA